MPDSRARNLSGFGRQAGEGQWRMTEVSDFFSLLDGPALIVTAQSDSVLSGCLVAFATQCSIYPPRMLVCLSAVNLTTTVASDARALGVHVLGKEQMDVASTFGEMSGDEADKLSRVAWHAGVAGAPILEDCSAWLEGLVLERIPLGDHVGYLLEVIEVGFHPDRITLLKSEVMTLTAGHPADEVRIPSERVVENLT
jgi:flavin reductase (DIM6/NTAB) family NADH-FMN oxidoreductase RutF